MSKPTICTDERPRLKSAPIPALALVLLLGGALAGCSTVPDVRDNPYGSSNATEETFWASCKPVAFNTDLAAVNCGDVILALMPHHVEDITASLLNKIESVDDLDDFVDVSDEIGGDVRHAYLAELEGGVPLRVWTMELATAPGVFGFCMEHPTDSSSCREVLPMVLGDIDRAESVGLERPVPSEVSSAGLETGQVIPQESSNPLGRAVDDPERYWDKCRVLETGSSQLGARCGSVTFSFFPVAGADSLFDSWRNQAHSRDELGKPGDGSLSGPGVQHSVFVTQGYRQHWIAQGKDGNGYTCTERQRIDSNCRALLPRVMADRQLALNLGLDRMATAVAAEVIELGVGESALRPPPDWYIAYKGEIATHRCEVSEGGYECRQL
ncbi:MAG TPA: hypothetical protein VLA12_18140, partial [Planctomycetaceae bacterium]|nr:hypothetical protein [Planctomycetaceae bacterium]